jgi:lipopolysaccharide export system permease protein
MNILDRYVAREFLRIYLLFSLAAPLLFIIGDWTDNLGKFADMNLTLRQVALSYMYEFPKFVLWSLPIAALIGTVFTVSNMGRHSELTAAKAGGVSFYRMLRVLPVMGVLLTGVGFALTEIVPHSMVRRAALLGQGQYMGQTRNDFVYRSDSGDVYTIRRLDAGANQITNISVERAGVGANGEGSVHISARVAMYDTVQGWTLRDGFFRTYDGRDTERTYQFAELRAQGLNVTPDRLLAQPKDEEELTYAEIGELLEVMRRSGGESGRLLVKREQKFAIPFATFIIILFGAPLANSSARSGAAFGVGISLGITILYMMLFKITGAAGMAGTMDPWLAAWLPNLLLVGGAVVLLARVRT